MARLKERKTKETNLKDNTKTRDNTKNNTKTKDDTKIKEIQKEIDNYIHTLEQELSENITEKINNQIEISVNKKMKEEEKKITKRKNRKILKRDILIILLTALTLYFGYCLYDIDYFNIRRMNYQNVVSANVNDNKVNPPYDNEYYIEKYRYLVDNMQIKDDAVFELYTGKITKENISNDLKLKLAYKNIERNTLEYKDGLISFKTKDLLSSIKKILGNNTTLDNKIFNYNNINFIYYNDTYLGLETKEYTNHLIYDIVSAKEEDNLLIFEVLIGVLDENTLLDINSNIITNKYDNEQLTKYKDKLSKFKYIFEAQDKNYYFNRIEKI